MRRLLLLRHGESRWNAEGRIQGQSCAGLSDRGHAQAAAVAEHYLPALRAVLVAGGEVVLVTSDLQRAVETVAPLADGLGLAPVHDARLRERAFGRWEGRTHEELAAQDAERWHRWTTGADVMGEIGAETAEQLAGRVAPALLEHHLATPDQGVCVVVTHGGSIWHGLHRLLALPARTLGPVGNAAMTELLLVGQDSARLAPSVRAAAGGHGADARPVLGSFNELGHLPESLRTGGFTAEARTDAVPQMR